jgi:predicted RNA-binding protein with RPS1 domain
VHISQIRDGPRIAHPTDVLQPRDAVFVKVLDVSEDGKITLSMKEVDQRTGEDVKPRAVNPAAPDVRISLFLSALSLSLSLSLARSLVSLSLTFL